MCKNRLILCLALFVLGICCCKVQAATVNASSCSSASIQAAINSANNGDTVAIPSCAATTWNTQVVVNKAVAIKGQSTCSGTPTSSCVDNTNITLNANQAFQLFPSATQFIEITGISFTIGGSCLNSPNSCIALWAASTAGSYRLHHVHIINGSSVPAILAQGYGLMDHILFLGSGTGRLLDNYGDAGNRGNTTWNAAQSWGDGNATFLEDSTLTISNSIDGIMDGFAGGRIVVRHNSFTYSGTSNGDTIGFHGTDSGSYRSHMTAEVYNNTITNSGSNTMRAGLHRGGAGLWHDNTYVGNFGGILLQYFRSCYTSDVSTWNTCNGTNWQIAVALDGTVTSGGYHFCATHKDQRCSSSADCPGAEACTAFFDASVNSCRDEPGKTHDQVITTGLGSRAWNNGSVTMGTDCTGHATFSNTQYVYTPYTYPHPLQSGGSTVNNPPNAPSNLSAVVN
jgi:hypothetical protein